MFAWGGEEGEQTDHITYPVQLELLVLTFLQHVPQLWNNYCLDNINYRPEAKEVSIFIGLSSLHLNLLGYIHQFSRFYKK